MERACVAMISGGLDSALAAKLMLEQGVAVHGLFLAAGWGCCEKSSAQAVARHLDIPLMVLGVGDKYLDVIRNPKYGYGAQMNPCVDCRIYMFGIAKRYMEEIGAGFIVTGEVIGQRPMSQRKHPLSVIERDAGLDGCLLRPLSAQLLPPTRPEQEGIVDRAQLLGLSGRSRQEQLALAQRYGITAFSQPAGGCQLTDETFARKTKDLFAHEARPRTKDMELLTVGRHFRISDRLKVILGRNELENLMLEGYAEEGYTFIGPRFAGPSALVVGPWDEAAREAAIRLVVRHTKADKLPEGFVEFRGHHGEIWTFDRMTCEAWQQAAPTAECNQLS